MSTSYLQEGDSLTIPTDGNAHVSDTPYLVGAAIFGVCVNSGATTDDFVLKTRGVFANMPKATGAAWAVGDILYWDNTAKNFTKTATSNKQVGFAVAAALSGDAVGTVKLGIPLI